MAAFPCARLLGTGALALCITACVGTLSEKEPAAQSDGVDGGAQQSDCDPALTTTVGGHHNDGQACQLCHGSGGGAPTFTLAGTVYDGLNSSAAVTDATVRVLDAQGTELSLPTTDNGNFWTTQALTFPLTVSISRCPDTVPMVTQVAQSGADCNVGGCHASGFRIFLTP
jgi:hypothetical protein